MVTWSRLACPTRSTIGNRQRGALPVCAFPVRPCAPTSRYLNHALALVRGEALDLADERGERELVANHEHILAERELVQD